jgi:hypothetical protein
MPDGRPRDEAAAVRREFIFPLDAGFKPLKSSV